jgi:hypothetical protein
MPPQGINSLNADSLKGLVLSLGAKIAISSSRRNVEVRQGCMPTAGHYGILDALLGSTTERVLGHAPCPVLATSQLTTVELERSTPPTAVKPTMMCTRERSDKLFRPGEQWRCRLSASEIYGYRLQVALGRSMTIDPKPRGP